MGSSHDTRFVLYLLTVLPLAVSLRAAETPSPAPLSDVDAFNFIAGTQTIGAEYQFTDEPRLVETTRAIHEMGSNILKFSMGKKYAEYTTPRKAGVKPQADPAIRCLADLAQEPAHKRVFEMPFAHYHIWAYTFEGGWWDKGLSKEHAEKEYREIHDLAAHLLKTYSGTGKTFYLGHWEGDWHLFKDYSLENDPDETKIQGMIDWLNIRQKAVDDARKETPHERVDVFHYTEVNQVQIGIQGKKCLTNSVLPKTNVDYVSYSSYDSLGGDAPVRLKKALDHIESKLTPKDGLPLGKRVWIGEYGFPADKNSPQKQDELSKRVIRTALEWGCPFVLYWEMYSNERKPDGQLRGFWLIDDQNVKQPVYHTHQKFLQQAKAYVAGFKTKNGRVPTADEFRKEAVKWVE